MTRRANNHANPNDSHSDADYRLRAAMPKDAPAICRLRRKVWLATYPNEKHGVTRDILLKLFDFTAEQTIAHYRGMIAGKPSGFSSDTGEIAKKNEAYQRNCAVNAGGEDDSKPDIEKFWVAESGKKSNCQLIAYASANACGNILTTIYVDPQWHKKGVGQVLFAKICEYLDDSRAIHLRVVSYNHNVIAFYARRGFVSVREQLADIEGGRLFPSLLMMRE